MTIERRPSVKLTVIREPVIEKPLRNNGVLLFSDMNKPGLAETNKKGVPETSQFPLPDGQSIELPPRLREALEVVFLADKENRDISGEEILQFSQSGFEKIARDAFANAISKCRPALREKGWEIKIVGYNGKKRLTSSKGTWIPRKIENPNTEIVATQSPQPEPAILLKKPRLKPQKAILSKFTSQEAPQNLPLFASKKDVNAKPAETEEEKQRQEMLAVLDQTVEPRIIDTIAKKIWELVIEAEKQKDKPKEENLEKVIPDSGLARKTVWERIRQHSHTLRPILRDLGWELVITESERPFQSLETNTFALVRYIPPPKNLPSSIEEIKKAPLSERALAMELRSKTQTGVSDENEQEDSDELKSLKIDLSLCVLSSLLNNGLNNLERNPYDLLTNLFGEKKVRNIVGRKDRLRYIDFILESVQEIAGRLIGETITLMIAGEKSVSKEEEKDKKILPAKEQQIVNILNELRLKGFGTDRIKIIDGIKKAISKHFSHPHQAKPIEDAAPIVDAKVPLFLPDDQTIELGGKSRKIFEAVIRARENNGEVSDENLLKIDPNSNPKKTWRYISKPLGYLKEKLAEKGWTIKNEGSRTGTGVGKRGRLVLRKIENEEHFSPNPTSSPVPVSPEDKVRFSKPVKQQKPRLI